MWPAVTQRLAGGATRLSSSRAFFRCRKGATAVEFALVAAPFMALLVAILQSALVFFAGRVLDEVTEEASRYIMTGQAQQGNVNQAGFKTYVCTGSNTSALVSALFTCSNIMVNVQNYADFASASTTSPTLTFNRERHRDRIPGTTTPAIPATSSSSRSCINGRSCSARSA